MIIFERYAKLKYKYGYRHFWSRGYYVSTVVATSKRAAVYTESRERRYDYNPNKYGRILRSVQGVDGII